MKNPRSCSQAELFSMINQVSFAVNDMTLYLDTHPDDDDAMAYFCENTALRKELLKEYAARFGPLTLDSDSENCRQCWDWVMQFPINIKKPDARAAQVIISQYGGPDGEMGASMRYLSQRFAMTNRIAMGTLTDIGTEELGHLEMVATIVHQLTRNLSMEEIEKSGFAPYYVDHTVGIWPQAAGGIPFNACEFQSKGDPITDLFEDMAADGATA